MSLLNDLSLLNDFTKNKNLPINHKLLNISKLNALTISKLSNNPNHIFIKADKNLGWTLVPISWFLYEYNRQLSDNSTYKLIPNMNESEIIKNSNTFFNKIQNHFKEFLTDQYKFNFLNTIPQSSLILPYMNIYPKVHKLSDNASPNNLNKLKGRPIITAHSWITSNPSRLLGTELDIIINKLQKYFLENNIPFTILKNTDQLYYKSSLCFFKSSSFWQSSINVA